MGAINISRTCSTFPPQGTCSGLSHYPNVTISEYGSISGADAMQKEIMERGPISCGIDAGPTLKYTGGIYTGDPAGGNYWWVRNSWGEFWGEMGYIRVKFGSLLVEQQCSWAAVQSYTEQNYPCYEGGENCAPTDEKVEM